MAIVGLTGGICSGKSTVASQLADLGAAVVDVDACARRAVAPGSAALERIVAEFGPEILDHQGRMNRSKMRYIIFNDDSKRLWLERLLHPQVHKTMMDEVQALAGKAPYLVLDHPLLHETGAARDAHSVLWVSCPRPLRLARAMERDGSDARLIERIMERQLDDDRQRALADDILDNSGSPEGLAQAVRTLHKDYLGRFANS